MPGRLLVTGFPVTITIEIAQAIELVVDDATFLCKGCREPGQFGVIFLGIIGRR